MSKCKYCDKEHENSNAGCENSGDFQKGNKPWNKNTSGYSTNYPTNRKLKINLSKNHKQKISEAVPKGENHSSWKGDNVGYASLHEWIGKKLGLPKKCEMCKTTKAKRFEWSNISKKYKRDLNDWIRLCTSCHRKQEVNRDYRNRS